LLTAIATARVERGTDARPCALLVERTGADILIMRTGSKWNDAGDGFAHLSQENPDLLNLMANIAQARTPGSLNAACPSDAKK
jgi:hypothetical protein